MGQSANRALAPASSAGKHLPLSHFTRKRGSPVANPSDVERPNSFFLERGNNDYGSLLLHIANEDVLSTIEVDFRRSRHVLDHFAVLLIVLDYLLVGIRCRVRNCVAWIMSRIRKSLSAGIHAERAGRKELCERQCQYPGGTFSHFHPL